MSMNSNINIVKELAGGREPPLRRAERAAAARRLPGAPAPRAFGARPSGVHKGGFSKGGLAIYVLLLHYYCEPPLY